MYFAPFKPPVTMVTELHYCHAPSKSAACDQHELWKSGQRNAVNHTTMMP